MQIRNAAAALLPATALVFGLFSGVVVAPASAAPAVIDASVVIDAPEGAPDPDDFNPELKAAGYGGTITRKEVIARAKNWWDRKIRTRRCGSTKRAARQRTWTTRRSPSRT